MTKDAESLTIIEHLRELRTRLVIGIIAITIAAIICYLFSNPIFNFLTKPYFDAFSENTLIGTGPAEAFILKIKAAFFMGVLLASPILFHQLWLFIAPGLHENEKRLAFPFVISTTTLFVSGSWFCFTVVLPFAFSFFKEQYLSIGITPTIRITEHLSLIIKGILGFGLVFQMPVIAYFLGRLGIINHQTLIAGARYAVVIIFIVAAVLTPPDILTQFLMAGPLLVLYGLSILIVKITAKDKIESHND